jgi:hypothetical protein
MINPSNENVARNVVANTRAIRRRTVILIIDLVIVELQVGRQTKSIP